ncbi:unnamed protein product [Caenorhabditis angaria]|uniref:DUF7869 domain-containing protein n=1 Tax=Caenorhabditis angaria TaxID=860376 RepID=A0A9P1ITM2_9PELO|nr:unnamed protein product [Caenorhabditis angaria]CAI5450541.1 unnamed protein product [Caenorhabditis angaria]
MANSQPEDGPPSKRKRLNMPTKRGVANIVTSVQNLLRNSQSNPIGGRDLFGPTKIDTKILEQTMAEKIHRTKILTMNKCQNCSGLEDMRMNAADPAKLKEINEQKLKHSEEMRQTRSVFGILDDRCRENNGILVIRIDGASNKATKIPILAYKPKSIVDANRISYTMTGVQVPTNGSTKFQTSCYMNLCDRYKKGSSYYFSLVLDFLVKLDKMPTKLFIIADNASPNKSDELLAGYGYLLQSVPNLKSVTLVNNLVGHSHNELDGYFGVMNQHLSTKTIFSTTDYDNELKKIKSTREVNNVYNVYDMSGLKSNVVHILNRGTHHQLHLFKDDKNVIMQCVAEYATTEAFEKLCNNSDQIPLFKDQNIVTQFVAPIVIPELVETEKSLRRLFKSGQGFFKHSHQQSILNHLKNYKSEDFEDTIKQLRDKPAYPLFVTTTTSETVTQYLERHGYIATNLPKPLVVQKSK